MKESKSAVIKYKRIKTNKIQYLTHTFQSCTLFTSFHLDLLYNVYKLLLGYTIEDSIPDSPIVINTFINQCTQFNSGVCILNRNKVLQYILHCMIVAPFRKKKRFTVHRTMYDCCTVNGETFESLVVKLLNCTVALH